MEPTSVNIKNIGGTIDQVSAGTLTQVGTILGIGGTVQVAGASAGTTVTVDHGTITIGNPTGTVVEINKGTINSLPQISIGTIPQVSIGTLPSPNIATGTQQTLGTVGVVNSVAEVVKGTTTLVSTVTTLSNLTNGSVNILTGTIQSSGTTTGVGVVSNVTNGSVNILTGTIQSSGAGTLTTGTLQNLVTGTLNALASGTITAGTFVSNGGSVMLGYPSFVYKSAAGTTTVKSAAGILHSIVVGSLLGGGTLYNSAGTSAAIIWSAITPPVGVISFNLGFGSLTFAGTGAQNVTIVYQ